VCHLERNLNDRGCGIYEEGVLIVFLFLSLAGMLVMLGQKSILVLQAVPAWNQPQARGMATLKAISMRLKSVTNIQKITQSMKMVSAAKYARAERELRGARPFGQGAQAFYEKAEVTAPEDAKNKLIVAMTSDRGLCGAVHSSVARLIRVSCCSDNRMSCIHVKYVM